MKKEKKGKEKIQECRFTVTEVPETENPKVEEPELEVHSEKHSDYLLDIAHQLSLLAHTLDNASGLLWWRASDYFDYLSKKAVSPLKYNRRNEELKIAKMMHKVIDEMEEKLCEGDGLFCKTCGGESYDRIMHNAAELARFSMLYLNHINTPEAAAELEAFMKSFPSSHRFTERDISNIRVKGV